MLQLIALQKLTLNCSINDLDNENEKKKEPSRHNDMTIQIMILYKTMYISLNYKCILVRLMIVTENFQDIYKKEEELIWNKLLKKNFFWYSAKKNFTIFYGIFFNKIYSRKIDENAWVINSTQIKSNKYE